MFTPDERNRLRDGLVAAAEADPRVVAAALVGSAAAGREDRWSDIDLAMAVEADVDQVVRDWTARLYRDGDAVHHFDVRHGGTLFRVFLLANTLQVDVSFWTPDEFGATGPAFRLLFGTAVEPRPVRSPEPEHLVGMGWLYALHARSSIARGRVWQAEHMVSGLREQVLALACLRHGVPAVQGRGLDDLPAAVTAPMAATLVRAPHTTELRRAFAAATEALLAEVGHVDTGLAARIADTVREMAGFAGTPL
ncbi:nucleotidyltransferase domain-containing protein [Actinosynnema sp. CS-041913]|uniref:nucleotidyltransferase domain-containing protein n=1 Tax=Actinosynnema sp. CS-041913 TaxID=3239917 RepID=UPI003D94FFFE